MRDLPSGLASHLGEGVTTLCRCWRLMRRDGEAFGFTDHDRDLVVDGQVYRAGTGLEAAETTAEIGFPVGGGDVSGILSSEALTETDIAAGLYDDASVELRLVNWAEPAQHLLLETASIGEIRRHDAAFVAELRGPMHRFGEERGRLFRATCGADLGDPRCGIDLDDPAHNAVATVGGTDGALGLTTAGLGAHEDGAFTGGRLTWLSGANEGLSVEVKSHWAGTLLAGLDLWQRATRPIAIGDTFRITAGCDKRLSTCRDRFANAVNFRGFPHMPGNDFVLAVAAQGEAGLDGGSLFR
ncbi:DUF2163 domain-containing protein [Enterovirga rhinocerotis]|uniref:Putative phage protein (TIGR02218 family) n=1 Tax=Enterovirga rhinocerotis TaxID=1339210 RepID=A0A4R7BUA0_9HYPH|nr:DUF2163 domain-containing protein [Enterovirga rhinocerotis]TDR88963.1 putative phage protein (TIGR02218 family) [Enterovirga rhinocerotis]